MESARDDSSDDGNAAIYASLVKEELLASLELPEDLRSTLQSEATSLILSIVAKENVKFQAVSEKAHMLSVQLESSRASEKSKDEIIKVKDETIAKTQANLEPEKAENKSLKTTISIANTINQELEEGHHKLEARELVRRLDDKVVLWIHDLVPALQLSKSYYGDIYSGVQEAVMLLQSQQDATRIQKVKKCKRKKAKRKVEWLYTTSGYSRSDLYKPLLVDLLDRNCPMTFEMLVKFNSYRLEKKAEGDQVAHGPRPDPRLEHYDTLMQETARRAFGGSGNVFIKSFQSWQAHYRSEWPNNTPTKMDLRRTRSHMSGMMFSPIACRPPSASGSRNLTSPSSSLAPGCSAPSRQRTSTPTLQGEQETDSMESRLNSALSSPRASAVNPKGTHSTPSTNSGRTLRDGSGQKRGRPGSGDHQMPRKQSRT